MGGWPMMGHDASRAANASAILPSAPRMLAPTAPPTGFSFKVASPLGGFLRVEPSTDLGVWTVLGTHRPPRCSSTPASGRIADSTGFGPFMRPEQGRGLQTGDGQSLDDSAGDFVSSCRCDDASATAQLGFFQGEQEIAAAEGREIETVGFIQQNLVRSGFPLLGRPHGTAAQDDNFRFRVDARLVRDQHARVLTEKAGGVDFPCCQSASECLSAGRRLASVGIRSSFFILQRIRGSGRDLSVEFRAARIQDDWPTGLGFGRAPGRRRRMRLRPG